MGMAMLFSRRQHEEKSILLQVLCLRLRWINDVRDGAPDLCYSSQKLRATDCHKAGFYTGPSFSSDVTAVWEWCAFILGGLQGCWGSSRGSSLWRRHKSRGHPRLWVDIAINLGGSHVWSVALSLSKGESSPEFSAGRAQTPAWLCCQNPCEQTTFTFCFSPLSIVLAQKTFSPKRWYIFSKSFVWETFLLTCLFDFLQLFCLVDSPQYNFLPSPGLNIRSFLGVKPQLNSIFINYELTWFLASYKHKNVGKKPRLGGFSVIYEKVQKSGHLNRSRL